MFGGRQLQDGASLASEGISDDSTMYILMRLLGGAKKRKKKTYTKPKKQKHKHKKIKLAVLKFYKASLAAFPNQHCQVNFNSKAPHLLSVLHRLTQTLQQHSIVRLQTEFDFRRWMTAARCSACARPAHPQSVDLVSSWPLTSTACTGMHPELSRLFTNVVQAWLNLLSSH